METQYENNIITQYIDCNLEALSLTENKQLKQKRNRKERKKDKKKEKLAKSQRLVVMLCRIGQV